MQNPAGSGERHCRRGEVRDMKVSWNGLQTNGLVICKRIAVTVITNAHRARGIIGWLDETKPLSGLEPSLDLAKGRVVVASERQIVPT